MTKFRRRLKDDWQRNDKLITIIEMYVQIIKMSCDGSDRWRKTVPDL